MYVLSLNTQGDDYPLQALAATKHAQALSTTLPSKFKSAFETSIPGAGKGDAAAASISGSRPGIAGKENAALVYVESAPLAEVEMPLVSDAKENNQNGEA